MPLQILIIGEQNPDGGPPLKDWIPVIFQPSNVLHETDIPRAMRLLQQTHLIPDLIVVIENHPDEYSRSDVDQLTVHAPLARWVVGYGEWSESAGRTRDVWPMAVRVPWHSIGQRLQQEWDLLNGKCVPALPMSGSREELFGADYRWEHQPIEPARVLVDSPDPEYGRYLAEFLTAAGHTVFTTAASGSPDAILCDLDPWEAVRQQMLEHLQEQYPGVPMIGLMSLPLPNLLDEREIHVLPKLGNQQQLLEAIAQR
jgi:hypothetical protein